jgi:hypothetical protein
MVGVMADGGGDFNVVTESEYEFTVLLVVESVTIGSALANPMLTSIKTKKMNLLTCYSYFALISPYL